MNKLFYMLDLCFAYVFYLIMATCADVMKSSGTDLSGLMLI